MVERLPGYGSAASAYLPPVSSTWPVTASRISACTTSCLSCRPASVSTIAGLVRGTPSASSPRMAGATRSTMALISAEPALTAKALVRGRTGPGSGGQGQACSPGLLDPGPGERAGERAQRLLVPPPRQPD